jgi:hypothetical protein
VEPTVFSVNCFSVISTIYAPHPSRAGKCFFLISQTPTFIFVKHEMHGGLTERWATQRVSLRHGVLHPDAHMFAQSDFCQSNPNVVASIMTQLSLKAGLKEWGETAHLAAHSEMKQLHFRNTFKLKHWHELTHAQRQMALESHMFLKEKHDKKIKG